MEGNDTSHIWTHTVRFREEKIEQDLQKRIYNVELLH